MTAALSSTAIPAAIPTLAALSGSNDTSAASTSAADAGGTASGLFAALLQKQMGKSAATDTATAGVDPALLLATDDSIVPEELQELGAELAALLPFMEAIGLTAKPTAAASEDAGDLNSLGAAETGTTPADTILAGVLAASANAETVAAPTAAAQIEATSPATPDLPAGNETPVALAIIPTVPLPGNPAPEAIEPPATAAQALAPLLAGKGDGKPDLAPQQSNPAATTAIIADQAAVSSTSGLETPGDNLPGRDDKSGGQAAFATQLAAAQGALQGANKEANAAYESAPGQIQLQTGQPGSAAGLTPADPQAALRNAAPSLPVATPVGTPQWSQEVGDKIVWLANRQESRAELVLTPPQMGRVEVSLTMNGDQATAVFTSSNPTVREALEASMPRLREAMADAGIQLGQAQVGAENSRQWAQQEKNGDNFVPQRGTDIDIGSSQPLVGGSTATDGLKTGRGLVDVFA